MPDGRDVRLKIKVDDAEVKQAEASLNRLKKAADSTGRTTSFGGKTAVADTEQQRKLAAFLGRELPQVSKTASTAIEAVETATIGASSGLGSVASAGGAVAIALAAAAVAVLVVVGVSALLTKEIFDLSKAFAAYGVEIGKSMDATGLMAESVSALRHESERQGVEFGNIERAASSFRKTIGEAAAGTEEARAKLAVFGLDGKRAIYDIDGAFRQAVKTIVSLPPGLKQTQAAFNAFGDDGYKLIPFFQSFNGNVDEAIKRAEDLGLVLSGKDVQASREFNRAFADTKAAIEGVKLAFGREFLETVTYVVRGFTNLLIENKDTIKSWAVAAGDAFEYVFSAAEKTGQKALDIFTRTGEFVQMHPEIFGDLASNIAGIGGSPGLSSLPNFDPSLNPQMAGMNNMADPAALNAMRAAQEEIRKKAEAEAEKLRKTIQAQTDEMSKRVYDLQFQNANFGKITEEAKMRHELFGKSIFAVNLTLRDQLIALAADKDALIANAEAAKKAEEARKKFNEAVDTVKNSGFDQRTAITAQNWELSKQLELGRELTDLEKNHIANAAAITTETEKARRAGFTQVQIATIIDELIKEQLKTTVQLTALDEKRAAILQQIKDKARDESYRDFQESLDDQLLSVQRINQPLTVYEQVLRDLSRDYKDLTEEQKANLLITAQQIDATTELNRQHAEMKEFFKTSFRYIFDGDIKGLFSSWADKIKDNFADKLGDIFATSLLGFNPNQTSNPVAKPIVKTLDTTNKILGQILNAVGGGLPGMAPGIGGGGGLNLGSIFGGSAGGGIFNFGGGSGDGGGSPSGSGSIFNPNQGQTGSINSNGEYVVNGGQASNFLSNIRNLFSTQPGGIFAPVGNVLNGGAPSAMGGILSGVGSIASTVGGMIPGRIGSTISMAGTGMQIGAMFGPWGALIGAGAGALLGFFGFKDPKRKQDHNENMPNLKKGFADSTAQFQQILADLRSMNGDPDQLLGQARDLRSQIASGFGIQFLSKKYKKQSAALIAQQLAAIDREPDGLMAQIIAAAAIARGAADRNKRILPEFAGGVFMSPDFRRYNGMLSGSWTGNDYRAALLADAEMVLNPSQQNNVRRAAGFDVFAGAGIPNYPRANPSRTLAGGGIAGGISSSGGGFSPNIMIQPNMMIELTGVSLDDKVEAFMTTDRGMRTQIKVVKKLQSKGDLKK